MAKLKSPFFSFGATGRLGKALTIVHRLTGPAWLHRGRPANPDTPAQQSWRNMYSMGVDLWHALSESEILEWERAGTRRHMTGFAWFMSQVLRPNPGLYLPLLGGTMAGEIDMDDYAVVGLIDPTTDDEAARKAYVDDQVHEHSFMSFRRADRYHFTSDLGLSTTQAFLADRLYAVPFYCPTAMTVTRLGTTVTGASAGLARLGIYKDNGSIYPGELVSDCGTINTTGTGYKYILGLNVPLEGKTLYWLVAVFQATPSLRCHHWYVSWNLLGSMAPSDDNMHGTWRATHVYGVLPDPYPGGATSIGFTQPSIGVWI